MQTAFLFVPGCSVAAIDLMPFQCLVQRFAITFSGKYMVYPNPWSPSWYDYL